jgi:hypothetical protein
MPDFEKPPKTATTMLIEGCMLFILFGIIAGALTALAVNLFNKLIGA